MFITCGNKLRIPKKWEDELNSKAQSNGYPSGTIRCWDDYDELLVKALKSDIPFIIAGKQAN